jgi:nitrogen fixation protein NifB
MIQPLAISESMQARIEKHPCYSEEAHHHYARMHVAVAPACNIQCNYCNRKYDCANESRPGVVSELLTPEEAAHKVLSGGGQDSSNDGAGYCWPWRPPGEPRKNLPHL